ncbi:uncharacterized protein LOC135242654 [Anguilla rostrata]|uniref:uncharacterized protein LOC135242654 n=1 Tax=Anguilla rostrata TaxID=7938 RepID=UPI0030D2DB33
MIIIIKTNVIIIIKTITIIIKTIIIIIKTITIIIKTITTITIIIITLLNSSCCCSSVAKRTLLTCQLGAVPQPATPLSPPCPSACHAPQPAMPLSLPRPSARHAPQLATPLSPPCPSACHAPQLGGARRWSRSPSCDITGPDTRHATSVRPPNPPRLRHSEVQTVNDPRGKKELHPERKSCTPTPAAGLSAPTSRL